MKATNYSMALGTSVIIAFTIQQFHEMIEKKAKLTWTLIFVHQKCTGEMIPALRSGQKRMITWSKICMNTFYSQNLDASSY